MNTKTQQAWARWIATYENDASQYINMQNAFEAGYEARRSEELTPREEEMDYFQCIEHDLYDDGGFYRCYACDYKESV